MANPSKQVDAGLELAMAGSSDDAASRRDMPGRQQDDASVRKQFAAAHKAADASQSAMRSIKLRKRVAAWMEKSGVGAFIIMLDGALSIASVINYIAGTYDVNNTYASEQLTFDLALSIFFVVSWFLWFWLDENKWGYVFSLTTLIDITTTLPTFLVVGGVDLPSLFFLRCLRVLRLLRLFRVASVSERLANEVFFAAVMLAFTLLCMLLIAASVFFELETMYGTTYPYLKFHESIYWAAVTLTTVGYGDYAPSIWATQTLLLLLLFATFTVLPYLSGKLVDAFNNTSKYERAKYVRALHSEMTHVVVMGSLDHHNMGNIVAEMYHADKEFDNRFTVFLAPNAPTTAMKRVLMATPHFERLAYLQGSPMDSKDLHRACVEHAEAVFICCNKFALDPATEDRMALMRLLSVGQYLQEQVAELSATYAQCTWRRVLSKVFPGLAKLPKSLPSISVQLLLPESRQRTQHVLHSLRQAGGDEALHVTVTNYSDQKPGMHLHPHHNAHKEDEYFNPLGLALADEFWHHIHLQLNIICLSELRHSLLSHSAMGVPGVIPLLCNLTTTLDYTAALKGKGAHAPAWLRHYMYGASQEIYQLAVFPECLIGLSFTEAAAFIYDLTQAVLLGTDVAGALGNRRDTSIAPLKKVITRALCGYVIADDVASVLDILEADEADLKKWRDKAAAAAVEEAADVSMDGDSEDWDTKDVSAGSPRAGAAVSEGGGGSPRVTWQRAPGIGRYTYPSQGGANGDLIDDSIQGRHSPSGAYDVEAPAANATASGSPGDPQQQQAHGVTWIPPHVTVLKHSHSTGEVRRVPEPILRTIHSSASMKGDDASISRRSYAGSSSIGGTSTSGRSSGWGSGLGGNGSESGRSVHNGSLAAQRQRRQSRRNVLVKKGVRYITNPAPGLHRAKSATGKREPPLAFLPIYMLRTGNRHKRAAADRVVEQHYHVTPRDQVSPPDVGTVSSMMLQHVQFCGHILIVGVPASLECLFSLLAPFRSKRLALWRPIVILDHKMPLAGTAWDDIARLNDVHYVQGSVANTDDLLRANAEGAAKAIILPALVADQASGGVHVQVTLTDEAVVDAYQQLRAINPTIEIYTELLAPGDMAFLRPSQPVPGVGALQETLAPAYLSGQVFQPGMIDTLMAQSFYTRGSDGILLRLLNQWHVGSAVTSMINEAKQHSKLLAPDELGAAPEEKLLPMPARAPTVLQVHIPEECIGWPYGRLWAHMLQQQSMLLLGLYRPVVQQGRCFCAVLTNPDKDLEVAIGDRAFVIYDLSNSKHLPLEVVGFDHDLPTAGMDGPGGPVRVGSATAGDGLNGAHEQGGWSEGGSGSREDSAGGAASPQGYDVQGDAAAKAAAAGESAQEARTQQQRRLRWQQQEQAAAPPIRLSLNMPFMGGTRINTSV